ncbi:uncharacterized protein [Chelonus insularis]|uniref:uncharacterized protein n=1 Tax=Chelonus insularis TaxID=460826 RepID=UPI00158A15CB|nr:uncharacterized protein LOC118069384 [Chelonus insularis]
MDSFSAPRYEGKIETFEPCIIDVQSRDLNHSVDQSHVISDCDQENHENEISIHEESDQPIQVSSIQVHSQQNVTLTPVRLPALLDGEFFCVVRIDDSNVTVRCLQCQKLLNGNLKSTGNFLSHLKRVHPMMIEKIKCKSNQRKPAIAYVDLSADKSPEVIKTKKGYRKCYKSDDNQPNGESVPEQPSNNWSEPPSARKRRIDENDSTSEINKFPQNNSFVIEDEFDAIGRNVAAKLRNMRLDQRIVAEKLLNDVLFEAQLGTLHRNSSLQV